MQRRIEDTPYNQLSIMPSVIAECVLDDTYVGFKDSCEASKTQETSNGHEEHVRIAEIESRRTAISPEEREQFVRLVDGICRDAYRLRVPWFTQVAWDDTNAGRDALREKIIPQYLAEFLTNDDLQTLTKGDKHE